MKKRVIILIIICLIIAGAFFIINKSLNKYNYEIEKISEYKYYRYKENNNYGVIDKDGNKIINATYSGVIIPNLDKDIFICYTGKEGIVLNSKGEKLFSEYEKVMPIKLKNVADALNYEKSVLIYYKDGKCGLMDFKGRKITKNLYESIENLQPTEGKLLVSKDNKKGVIDIKGNILVDTKYDVISSDNYFTEDEDYKKSGFIIENITDDGHRYGYVDYKGKTILEVKYNEIMRLPRKDKKDVYLIASENGKFGLYNNTKEILKKDYQDIIYSETTNCVIFQKNQKYGVANLNGKIIIEPKNEELIDDGVYFYAKSGTENIVYDVYGNKVNMNFNRRIYTTSNENYRISTILNNNITYYGVINKNDTQIVSEKYRYIEYLFDNYFIAKNDEGKLGIINDKEETIFELKYESLQKIKDKNIIQTNDSEGIIEFYSKKLEKVASIKTSRINAEIDQLGGFGTETASNYSLNIKDDYLIINSENNKIYLNNDGEIIQDISTIQDKKFPDNIKNYKKIWINSDDVYYSSEEQ